MSFIGRVTTFVAGTLAKASEVNAELDNIINWANGGVTDVNLNVTADVAQSKIADISGTDSAARADLASGNSASPGLSTTLELEMNRMRHRIKQNGVGTGAVFLDAAGAETACSWHELPIIGTNLLTNPSFEQHTLGAGEAPDGWVKVGTPSTLTTQVTAVTEGKGNDLRIIASAGNEGIAQTVTEIKADAFYLVGCRAKQSVGTAHLFTVGALAAANDYQDIDLSTTSGTYVTLAGVVQADSTPTDITVSMLAALLNDDIKVDHAFMYELGPIRVGYDYTDYSTYEVINRDAFAAGTDIGTASSADFFSNTAVALADRASEIEITGYISVWADTGNDAHQVEITLQQDINAAASWTDIAGGFMGPHNGGGCTIPFHYIVESPTAGDSYEFRVLIDNQSSNTFRVNQTNSAAAFTFESAMTTVVRPKR